MGCSASSIPAPDPADILVAQATPEEPLLADAGLRKGFVVLVAHARSGKAGGALRFSWTEEYSWKAPRPVSRAAKAENFDTAEGRTVVTRLSDFANFTKFPFLVSFFGPDGEVSAVLTGHGEPFERGDGSAVLFARRPRAGATGHVQKTAADGVALHPFAEVRPLTEEQPIWGQLYAGTFAIDAPFERELGVFLAGPNGSFGEDPDASQSAGGKSAPLLPELLMTKGEAADGFHQFVRTVGGEKVALALCHVATQGTRRVAVAANVDVVLVLSLLSVWELNAKRLSTFATSVTGGGAVWAY